MLIRSHKDLIVWQKAMQLTKMIFLLTNKFPDSEKFGLVSQMRRAAVSIPSNIAEGHGRQSRKELKQFYATAYGSALELETQMILAKELKFGEAAGFQQPTDLLLEVLKMLNVIIRKIDSRTYHLEPIT